MLTSPQTVTVLGVAQTLNSTSTGQDSATYTEADDNYQLSISHQYGKRAVRAMRLRNRKIAADPFISGVQKEYTQTVSVVVNTDKIGFTVAEVVGDIIALADYLKANTNAVATKFASGES